MIDAFERANPSVQVELLPLLPGPASTDAEREIIKNRIFDMEKIPDVYLGDVIWPAEFGHSGLALPLNNSFPAEFWNRFSPSLVDGVTYRRQKYAVPFYSEQGLLFYRKDLLEQFDFSPPATWDELVDQAKILQGNRLVEYGFAWQGAAFEGLTCYWMELLADAGGRILTADGARSQINSPQSFKALQFLLRLVAEGITPPEVSGFQESAAIQFFISGKSAFLRGWNSSYTSVMTSSSSQVAGRVGVAPLPTFSGRDTPGHSTAGGWNLYVNPYSANPMVAMAFLSWMTGVQAQRIVAQYSKVPVNAAVRGDPEVMARDPTLAVVRDTRLVLRPSTTPYYPQVSKVIYTRLHEALVGVNTVSPQAVLQEMDQEINDCLRGSR